MTRSPTVYKHILKDYELYYREHDCLEVEEVKGQRAFYRQVGIPDKPALLFIQRILWTVKIESERN